MGALWSCWCHQPVEFSADFVDDWYDSRFVGGMQCDHKAVWSDTALCHATTYALVERLGLRKDQYTISFQSRLGRDPWIQPYTIRVLEDLAKVKKAKRLLVFCPAFTSDCLETTIEISDEYNEEFQEWGGEHIDLVPSLNDHPAWIKAVADMVRR